MGKLRRRRLCRGCCDSWEEREGKKDKKEEDE
jgi:hypothetical protein